MTRLASVINTFEADFLAQYGNWLSSEHLRALSAIKRCRTQASAKMQAACSSCDHQVLVPHSCGHRHCPHCQHHESQRWLEQQIKKRVPSEYFLLTFTVPSQLRTLAMKHQKLFYELLMRCSWETVKTFTGNDKQLRGTPGAVAVLHTNTRRLDYHPHVHLLMPAAAVDSEQGQWRTKRNRRPVRDGQAKGNYLFNHKALAKVFRAKLLAGIEAAGLTLPASYPVQWVVDCKSVGTGEKALVYLGRYLYRGVIQEKDIVACQNGQVIFRFTDAKTGKREVRTLPGAQFLWLVLQHVLPRGFRRARNFGFLHPNCKRVIALLHVLLKFAPATVDRQMRERAQIPCPCCGAAMRIVRTGIASLFAKPKPPPSPEQGSLFM